MAKDPVCGMYVEEKPDSIRHFADGREYFFCATQCLNEFTAPEKELKNLKLRVFISIALTIPITLFTYFQILPSTANNYVLLALSLPIQFWAGLRFYKGAFDALRTKASNMDTLIAVGTSAAFFYSTLVTFLPHFFLTDKVYFETSAIIISLILVGRLIETRTKEKASQAVRKLLDIQPSSARVLREGAEQEIPIEQVMENDLCIVRPGERIPTDGVVTGGYSQVDESAMTGESMPVDKQSGSYVIGSTINKSGLLRIRATKIGHDTVLSQIIDLVQQARTGKASIQRTADEIAKYFVPAIASVATVAALLWYLIGGIGLAHSILVFVSVIVIACPCALGIATPAALMIGSGKAAENGILIKGGEYLEIAKKVKVAVFDKTGTLTKGKPEVTDVIPLGNFSSANILHFAAAAESASEHPLGEAIIRKARSDGIVIGQPESFEAIPGLGLSSLYEGHKIIIGNRNAMAGKGVSVTSEIDSEIQRLEGDGKTTALVAVDGVLAGIFAMADKPADNALQAIDKLKKMGIEVIMLTGDNEKTARAVALSLGIDKVIAGVLPAQKEKVIAEIKSSGKVTAMIGDGINDAPALARADIGIAIGSGTDVAKETGGIILLKSDLRDVVIAFELGAKTVSKIKQNLFWAFAYNVVLVPIAAGALVPLTGASIYDWLPYLAAGAMALSSITVVANSLLLGRYRPHFQTWKSRDEEAPPEEEHGALYTEIR